MKGSYFDPQTIRNIRMSTGMSMLEFWKRYGVFSVTSAARYETKSLPEAYAILNYLVHVKGLNLEQVRTEMLSSPIKQSVSTK